MSKLCEEVRKQLPLYIGRLLTEEELSEFDSHLRECADCRQELAFLNGILGAAKTLPELPVTDDFRAGLREKLAATEVRPKGLGQGRKLYRYLSGAIVAAAIIAFSVVSFHNLPKHPDLTSNDTTPLYTVRVTETPSATPAITTKSPAAPEKASRPVTQSDLGDQVIESGAEEKAGQPEMAAEGLKKERSMEVPSTPEVQAASVADRVNAAYDGATVTGWQVRCNVSEEGYEAALALVASYEKQKEGVLVPAEQLSALVERISNLPGFISMENQSETAEENTLAYLEIHCQS